MKIHFGCSISLILLIACSVACQQADSRFFAQKGSIAMQLDNLGKLPADTIPFRLQTDSTWKLPDNGPNDETKVEINLIVSNNTLSKVALYLLDTITIQIAMEDGTSIPVDGGRNGIFKSVDPVAYINPGMNLQICRSGVLSWSQDRRILRLTGSDDFGGIWYFDDLHRGNYLVRVIYENNKVEVNGVRLWKGKGATRPIKVNII